MSSVVFQVLLTIFGILAINGRFSLGTILGRDQGTRTRWERMLRTD